MLGAVFAIVSRSETKYVPAVHVKSPADGCASPVCTAKLVSSAAATPATPRLLGISIRFNNLRIFTSKEPQPRGLTPVTIQEGTTLPPPSCRLKGAVSASRL